MTSFVFQVKVSEWECELNISWSTHIKLSRKVIWEKFRSHLDLESDLQTRDKIFLIAWSSTFTLDIQTGISWVSDIEIRRFKNPNSSTHTGFENWQRHNLCDPLLALYYLMCCMKLNGVDEEHVKLKAFPFSLKATAKAWFFFILPGSIGTWNAMKKIFLEKYFPASRVANIRKEMCGIWQSYGETLSEYWERFEQLCIQCPHHQIPNQLLIHYFYEGLMATNRSIIDAASGRALEDKTPEAAHQLILNMAANFKQFSTRGDFVNKQVNEVSISNLENKVNDITSLMRSLACGNVHQVKVCGICSLQGHTLDMCPTMQEDYIEHVHAVDGGFNGQPKHKYDPFSNMYNPGWRDHPNLYYGNPP